MRLEKEFLRFHLQNMYISAVNIIFHADLPVQHQTLKMMQISLKQKLHTCEHIQIGNKLALFLHSCACVRGEK
jgi:hypothetical protein